MKVEHWGKNAAKPKYLSWSSLSYHFDGVPQWRWLLPTGQCTPLVSNMSETLPCLPLDPETSNLNTWTILLLCSIILVPQLPEFGFHLISLFTNIFRNSILLLMPSSLCSHLVFVLSINTFFKSLVAMQPIYISCASIFNYVTIILNF